MKQDTFANRLKLVMSNQQLRQIDILNRAQSFCKKYGIKIEKNDLSQYVNEKHEPSPKKLIVLAEALNVSKQWLLGYDVPMKRK